MTGAVALVDIVATIPAGATHGALALEVVERLGVGIMVVGSDRRVLSASPLVERILSAPDGLELRDGCLHANRASLDVTLAQLLTDGCIGAGRSRCLSVFRPSGKPALVVAIVGEHRYVETAPGRLVLVWDSGHALGWCRESLADLHGLTRAEARTVLAMLEEHSVPRVGRRLGLSDNTVRTHLKQAFRKCGVRGWAQLAVRLAGNPLRGSLDRVSREN